MEPADVAQFAARDVAGRSRLGPLLCAIALMTLWPNPLTWLIAVMIVGTRQLGLAILMHEAAHGGLPAAGSASALLDNGLIRRMEVRPGYLDVMRLATSRTRA